jgi:hypothetical protein
MADEAAQAFSDTLESAWTRLTAEERCALVWKHRHGLKQRRIATLLGVREDKVSRWISRAVAKLAGAVGGGTGPPAGLGWESLRQILDARLASSADPPPPPDDGPSPRESP